MYQLAELQKYLKRISAGHLLDVATGEGDFLLFLLESFSSFDSATGLDINPENLKTARNKIGRQKVDFLQGNVRRLPFEDNYFDTITVSNSIHHFDNPVKAIQSMLRVLVPGGLFVINEMINEHLNPAQQTHFDYHSLKAEIDTASGGYHRKIYSLQELQEIIRESGLVPAVTITNEDPPIIYSHEKMWQFFHKLDDFVSNAIHLPNGLAFEQRAQIIKEMIELNGFQKPPQVGILAYKD
ncbi:MAG TPA: class I SAM-dependent methyltransferase [Prolixibacteraceae bacterium]|nr:class I SAM-dependent methyltransferase [Prolixibacteraceae bacterium]